MAVIYLSSFYRDAERNEGKPSDSKKEVKKVDKSEEKTDKEKAKAGGEKK